MSNLCRMARIARCHNRLRRRYLFGRVRTLKLFQSRHEPSPGEGITCIQFNTLGESCYVAEVLHSRRRYRRGTGDAGWRCKRVGDMAIHLPQPLQQDMRGRLLGHVGEELVRHGVLTFSHLPYSVGLIFHIPEVVGPGRLSLILPRRGTSVFVCWCDICAASRIRVLTSWKVRIAWPSLRRRPQRW